MFFFLGNHSTFEDQPFLGQKVSWVEEKKLANVSVAKPFFAVQTKIEEKHLVKKNPAYERQSISRPMRIVAPIPKKSC